MHQNDNYIKLHTVTQKTASGIRKESEKRTGCICPRRDLEVRIGEHKKQNEEE